MERHVVNSRKSATLPNMSYFDGIKSHPIDTSSKVDLVYDSKGDTYEIVETRRFCLGSLEQDTALNLFESF